MKRFESDRSSEPAPSDEAREITGLLLSWRAGDSDALGELLPRVYAELRGIARHLLRRERFRDGLETAGLVHEAYLRLVDIHRIDWESRLHFFAMCSRIMRRVLVDQARRAGRLRRGGDRCRVATAELRSVAQGPPPDLLEVDEALTELARCDEQLARIVELRFFGGLTRDEIAEVTGLSSATVTRRWFSARAWLLRYLEADAETPSR